jgi:hypothetical protein
MGAFKVKHANRWLMAAGASAMLLMAGCGGGGGGAAAVAQTGVFQDSPVDGLGFSTATQSGTTSNGGQFQYLTGETVSFYLGNRLLGQATGAATLTPVDIVAGANGEITPEVISILRLLQTLDADSNTTNGITLPSLDGVTLPEDTNISDIVELDALLDTIDTNLTLVDHETALSHFIETISSLGGTLTYTDYLGNQRTAVATAGDAEYHTGTGYGNTMFDSADKKCQNCHNELYDTWKSSMHGKSWTDPIFQSKFQDFLRTHIAKIGSNPTGTLEYTETKFKGVAQTCIKCHAPGAYYAGDVQVTLTALGTNPTTADLTAAQANNQANSMATTGAFDPSQAINVVSVSQFNDTLYQASFDIGHEANKEGINCAFCHSIESVRLMSATGSDGGQYTLKDALRVGPVGTIKANAGDTLNYDVNAGHADMNKFFRIWGPEKYADPSSTPKGLADYDVGKAKDGRYTMHSTKIHDANNTHYTGGPFYGPYGVTGKANENADDTTNRVAMIHPDYDMNTNNHFGDQGKALCMSCHQRSAGAAVPAGEDGAGSFMELCSTWNAVTTGTDSNHNDSTTSPKCQKCHMERIDGTVLHRWADPDTLWTKTVNPGLTPYFDANDTTVGAGDNPVRDGWLNSHAFLGASKTGHKASVVAKIQSGFNATLAQNVVGNTLTVTATLRNETAHMFPGAHPMRRVLTRIIVTDGDGNKIDVNSSAGNSTFADITNTLATVSGKTLHASQSATVTVVDAGNAALNFPGKTPDLTGAAVSSQKFDGTSVIVTAPDGTVKSQEINATTGAIQGTVKNAAIVDSSDASNFTRIYGHETGKKYDGTFVVRPGFDSNMVAGDTRLSPNETETYTLDYDITGETGVSVTYKVYYMQKGAGGSFPTTADGWLDDAVNAEKKLLITEVYSETVTVP